MKEHSRASLNAALLLLLLGGCASTGVDISTAQEIGALAKAFKARMDQRYTQYKGAAEAARAEASRFAVEPKQQITSFLKAKEMEGRMGSIESFKNLTGPETSKQWYANGTDRITKEKTGINSSDEADRLNIEALGSGALPAEKVEPLLQRMAQRAGRSEELRGEQLEADLVMQDVAVYEAEIVGSYRRGQEIELAEDLARQQSLLLLFGGLQQINYNLQEQDRYNQQQRYQQEQQFYQQQLLYELSKPTRCYTFGATTTCN